MSHQDTIARDVDSSNNAEYLGRLAGAQHCVAHVIVARVMGEEIVAAPRPGSIVGVLMVQRPVL